MIQANSSVAILGIGTAVPAFKLEQAHTSMRITEALQDYPDSARWAKRIFKQCGVETRYTCEPNLLEPADRCRYFLQSPSEQWPSTAERMETYKRESVPLALAAARKALDDANVPASDITHLITVSCTGQFLPGMDTILVSRLGLAATVNRLPLNFLGCAAGLRGISLSKQIIANHAAAKVLMVCVELCTLHIQPSSEREALFGASFFGDGASACVSGSLEHERSAANGAFRLGADRSVLLSDCADEMVWEVGNFGFDLYLSPNIPRLIGRYIPEQIEQLISEHGKPELWAIHPGGKGIIDTLAELYGLSEEQSRPSRTVLRNYGNMSSATILFVLSEMRQGLMERDAGPSNGLALAFGPGLTCEMIQFGYVPSNQRREAQLNEIHV
ncbi:type III polyketide synthase [Paenibacillus harenae]|uniref:type III polyketide synthase n=1 Tax=Paenibacillus harenae TaxID=306543 RepID=UPI0027922AFC|nr:type III polyketide synthase [Paenibacillus harenae]MDQ0057905.1 putative naringenin-chalcone synthase [Paenibacillus harenae]